MIKLSKKEKVVLILIGLLTVTLPFLLEKILFEENFFPFNFRIAMSREVWFGFVGSYLGAIGAFSLGYVAYRQNKKYNEQSTEFVSKQQELLENIQNLNQQQADNLLRHKFYDIYVTYSKDLENYFQTIYKYDDNWAYSMFIKMQDKSETDTLIEYAKMTNELKNISVSLVHNFSLFKDREIISKSLKDYSDSLSYYTSYKGMSKFKQESQEKNIDISEIFIETSNLLAVSHLILLENMIDFMSEIKIESLSILQESTTIDEIKKKISQNKI